MKRYRVLSMDFDRRAVSLNQTITPEWSPEAIANHQDNLIKIATGLVSEFGGYDIQQKIINFRDIGPSPISVQAFHNKFQQQIRTAFIQGSYYPALTGVCALGERILNHLILKLRDHFKNSKQYKQIYDKDSFQDWTQAIDLLTEWEVLLPDVATSYYELRTVRNNAIHFQPEIDQNDRELALEAIRLLTEIIAEQFSSLGTGTQPWFITGIRGASFIKKEAENWPFVNLIFIKTGNCAPVSPFHKLNIQTDENGHLLWVVHDEPHDDETEISDEEFADLYNNRGRQQPPPETD